MSMVEAVANFVIGPARGHRHAERRLPLPEVEASLGQTSRRALVFTMVWLVRSFLLRRAFEALRRQQHWGTRTRASPWKFLHEPLAFCPPAETLPSS